MRQLSPPLGADALPNFSRCCELELARGAGCAACTELMAAKICSRCGRCSARPLEMHLVGFSGCQKLRGGQATSAKERPGAQSARFLRIIANSKSPASLAARWRGSGHEANRNEQRSLDPGSALPLRPVSASPDPGIGFASVEIQV